MDLNEFLRQSKEAAPKQRSEGESQAFDGMHTINMGAYVNFKDGDNWVSYPAAGTIRFLPILAVHYDTPTKYLYNVMEFQVNTAAEGEDAKWKWSRFPESKDFETELTKEQKDLIENTRSLISKAINELDYGTDWARSKNYAAIFGYVVSHINTDETVITDKSNRKLALILVPSKNYAKAMTDCLSSIATTGGQEMYEAVFSREVERQTYVELTCKRSSGFGYDVTVNAKVLDMFSSGLLTDEEKANGNKFNIPERYFPLCKSHILSLISNNTEDSVVEFDPEYYNSASEFIAAEVNKTIADNRKAQEVQKEVPDSVNTPTNPWSTQTS